MVSIIMVNQMTRTKKTGIDTRPPGQTCEDPKCPYHGKLKVRGKLFTGTVVSDKMQKSVVVEWLGWRFIPKYERYKKTRTKVAAHNPKCIDAKEGDVVQISECRPLSKTKNFVVMGIGGKERDYELKKEAVAEAKHKAKAKEEFNKAKQAEQAAATEPKPKSAEADVSED